MKNTLIFLLKKYRLPPLTAYTPKDLFNFCCVVCEDIFIKALDFFNDPNSISADEYFSQNRTNYLGVGNWNLDTGLPSLYNNHALMRSAKEEHYSYKTDELIDIYSELNNLFISSRFK